MRSGCGKLIRALLAGAALVLLAACSDYNMAQQAYQAGDYKVALERFEKLAKAGDVHAQFDLAQMYNQGIGVDANPEQGWLWLRQSANGGNPAAMLEMGMRFESGVGPEQNFIMALSWYRKASEAGNAVARFNIATMYLLGAGVPKDQVKAYGWFKFADKLGSPASQARMEQLEKLMTPLEIERGKKYAEELVKNPDL